MPWTTAGSLIHKWLPPGAWPEDIAFKDPSHLGKDQCIRLIHLWEEMDKEEGFRFTGWITGLGLPATDEYTEYIEGWKADAPIREERRRLLAEYKASKVNAKATSGKSQPSPVQRPTQLSPSRGDPGASGPVHLPSPPN